MKEMPYSYDKYLYYGLFMMKKASIFSYPISHSKIYYSL